jgi:hypothetical protein
MLKWFRTRASTIAAVGLVSVLGMSLSAVTLHGWECHDACAPGVLHDESSHQLRSDAAPGDHPLHCLVCHWARSFRPRAETRIVHAPAVCAGACIHVELFTASSPARAAQPPLRSPPRSTLA